MANFPNQPEKNDWFEDYGYAVIILGAVMLTIFAVFALIKFDNPNTDPNDGYVRVKNTNVYKVCDGRNLIIQGRSTVVVQNSQECS